MILRNTRSVCPVCLSNIPAQLREQPDGSVFMEKTCPQHGDFRTVVWRGRLPFDRWTRCAEALRGDEGLLCPENCGLCGEHRRGSCCVLLEVTRRCNLRCRFCFADAGEEKEPSFADLREAISDVAHLGHHPMLQFSGGEPTLRNDLPELVHAAKEAGIPYVQVNTNGIRLAEDPGLACALAEAGLDFVFLQFDGVDDSVYRTLRGRELFAVKEQAIENSGKAGLAVTLVPTMVPGVNLAALGNMVKFAVDRSPVVRGVHFQPVSYFGRIPGASPTNAERFTLDELLISVCEQTGLQTDDFIPSRCDHPLCGFHGSFIAEEGKLIPLTRSDTAPTKTITARENREFVARHWVRKRENEAASAAPVPVAFGKANPVPTKTYQLRLAMEQSSVADMDVFLKKVRTQSFTLSSMPFQDAMNLDMERLRSCSLHVYGGGKLRPLCAAYLTPMRKETQP